MGVPSRLYTPPSAERPLNGLRVTVKDNYHLAGVHTTLGSRSYAKLYGPQSQTSELVKRLVDLGAVIIGKTKMGAYAGSEVPPEKCIDYFPPWNPRGDEYQGPSGSSSGTGASVASYPWVDIALGTDSMLPPSDWHRLSFLVLCINKRQALEASECLLRRMASGASEPPIRGFPLRGSCRVSL